MLCPAILVIVTLACYWVPLTSDQTSIQWDAADEFQPAQDYVSQELHEGRIPFWSPYPWGGYPFLADPQAGAWYPLNWPFFLVGVTPHALVAEHWLHILLASLGAYFLAMRLLRRYAAALLAGLAYGLSGFFVGHSSHTPMLECAAWAPWLMVALDRGLESAPLRYTLLGGLAGGAMILGGHFQTILYGFLALALFAAAVVLREPRRWARVAAIAAAMPILGTLLSAVSTAPGLELTLHSIRTSLTAISRTEGFLPLKALATLIYPNFFGVLSGDYHGPQDVTQYYLYAGILVVPLAILGLLRPAARWAGALLIAVPVWYAAGPSAGLYLLVARLPGFSSVRAPINIWFVPALGLALLAAAGLAYVMERWPVRRLAPAVVVVACVDLIYFQSAANPLAYGRESYYATYAAGEELFHKAVVVGLPPLTRFDAPERTPAFGPLSHYLDQRTEVTYGYGPLVITRYQDYLNAMRANPKLRDGLNVSRWLDAAVGAVRTNPGCLPRANFPKALVEVTSDAEGRARLATLDQHSEALVPAGVHVAAQDGAGTAQVTEFSPGHYRIHFHCASASLLRIGNAFFDGWTAASDGRPLQVVPVDHALIGVVVPSGEGDLELSYHSTYFLAGGVVTAVSLAVCLGLLVRPWLGRRRKLMA